jgi:hypothetical protein
MEENRQPKKGISPELLEFISPEQRRKREERRRRTREHREKAEWHLARAKRLRDSLKR